MLQNEENIQIVLDIKSLTFNDTDDPRSYMNYTVMTMI